MYALPQGEYWDGHAFALISIFKKCGDHCLFVANKVNKSKTGPDTDCRGSPVNHKATGSSVSVPSQNWVNLSG